MFDLIETKCKFTDYNPRVELHGETPSPATDISLSALMSNDVLNDLCPGMREALYEAPTNPDLVEAADPDSLTALRFPFLKYPLTLNLELKERKLTIDYGLGAEGGSNVVLPNCKVSKFTVEPQNGGTVLVKFQVTAHPDEKQSGWLYTNQKADIVISLETPEEPQGDIFAAPPAKKTKKEIQAEAKAALEAEFSNPL
ncbi:MAG: hypothetical protein ACRYF5_16615, partial [Janthinobacterium lividum]